MGFVSYYTWEISFQPSEGWWLYIWKSGEKEFLFEIELVFTSQELAVEYRDKWFRYLRDLKEYHSRTNFCGEVEI